MTATWKSQVCPPEGAALGDGIAKQLGKPSVDPLTTLVRESVQNSWDARMDDSVIDVTFHLQRLGAERGRIWRRHLLRGLVPETGINLGNAISDDSYILTISDRGTRGLGGPMRADEACPENVHSDFVQFLRNVGEASDHKLGGGTYGFGKGILYNSSSAGAILVDTNCVQSMGVARRFMGAALGLKFEIGNIPYTGRHWYGSLGADDVIDPLTGTEAERMSKVLGMPGFCDDEFGSDITIVGFRLGKLNGQGDKCDAPTRKPDQAIRLIIRSIVWNLWPKMGSARRPEQIRFHVLIDGKEISIPSPEDDPVLHQFVKALDDLDAGEGFPIGRKTVSPKHLGDLVLRPMPSGLESGTALSGEGCPIDRDAPLRHVCRMRQAQLVVDYFKLDEHPDNRFGYVGAFRSSAEADHLFAESEPPTHDYWMPQGNSSKANNAVRTTTRIMSRVVRDKFLSRDRTSGAVAVSGLGAVAAGLSPLLTGVRGTGASFSSDTAASKSVSRRVRSEKPTVKVLETEHVGFIEGEPVILARVKIKSGSRPSVVTAVEEVILDDGGIEGLDDAPEGAIRPNILRWESRNGQVIKGGILRLPGNVGGEWIIIARYLPDCVTRIRIKVDEDDA